jgi:hypothetical protein
MKKLSNPLSIFDEYALRESSTVTFDWEEGRDEKMGEVVCEGELQELQELEDSANGENAGNVKGRGYYFATLNCLVRGGVDRGQYCK